MHLLRPLSHVAAYRRAVSIDGVAIGDVPPRDVPHLIDARWRSSVILYETIFLRCSVNVEGNLALPALDIAVASGEDRTVESVLPIVVAVKYKHLHGIDIQVEGESCQAFVVQCTAYRSHVAVFVLDDSVVEQYLVRYHRNGVRHESVCGAQRLDEDGTVSHHPSLYVNVP